MDNVKITFRSFRKTIVGEFIVKTVSSNWFDNNQIPMDFFEYYVKRVYVRNEILAIILEM